MKKLNKCFVLVGVVAIVVGISGLFYPTNKINKNIKTQIAKAYNHSTENALDNVFMKDNDFILPFIFSNINQATTLDIKTKFEKAGLTIKNMSTDNVGTGTQIAVNENTNIYNILIYGDVNGDGQINLIDVQRIILHYLNPSTNALTGLNAMAANVNNKDNNDINLIDAQRVILFYLGNLNSGLVVEEPKADKEKDYITGIKITSPDKHIYNYGEELDLTGGKVHVIYASGDIRTINMISSMITGYDKNRVGIQTVTVSCKTQNTIDNTLVTFNDTFTVTVRAQSGGDEPVIPKPPTTKDFTGYRYQELTILDNVNEDLTFEIKKVLNGNESILELKDNGEYYIADKKVAKIISTDGTIKFIGYEEGRYEIDIGQAKPITVLILEDKSINYITLSGLNNNSDNQITIKQGIPSKIEIKFWHVYKVDNNVIDKKEIKVDISKVSALISEQLKELLEIKFLNGNDIDISNTQNNENLIIEKVWIQSKQAGTITLPIVVINDENKTYTENIEITVKEMELVINDGNEEVTLYRELPENNTLVKEIINEDGEKLIYTLVPIYKIDENGEESIEIEGQTKKISRVKVKDIKELNVEGDISFGGINDDTIILEAFNERKDIIEDTKSNELVYYIGIATLDDGTDKATNIEVTYAGQNITTLKINIIGDISSIN